MINQREEYTCDTNLALLQAGHVIGGSLAGAEFSAVGQGIDEQGYYATALAYARTDDDEIEQINELNPLLTLGGLAAAALYDSRSRLSHVEILRGGLSAVVGVSGLLGVYPNGKQQIETMTVMYGRASVDRASRLTLATMIAREPYLRTLAEQINTGLRRGDCLTFLGADVRRIATLPPSVEDKLLRTAQLAAGTEAEAEAYVDVLRDIPTAFPPEDDEKAAS